MTSTQSIPNPGLTAEGDDDQMEMGTSPYPHIDDIDFDLDEQHDQSIEDNSMVDDATDNMDSMQAENSTVNQDDLMYDEELDDEVLNFEEDFDMNAEEEDNFQQEYVEQVEEITDPHQLNHENFKTQDEEEKPVTDATIKDSQHNVDEEEKQAAEDSNIIQEKREEENTNTDHTESIAHSQTDQQNDPTEQEDEASVHTVAINNDQAAVNVLDFATNASSKIIAETEPTVSAQNEQQTVIENFSKDDEEAGMPEEISAQPPNITEEVDTGETHDDTKQEQEEEHHVQETSPSQLHTVIIEYDGQNYPLFAAEDEDKDKALLHDPALAFNPINLLLKELQSPFAEYLWHDDEMVLDIPSLGLHICEDSKYAEELTLAQVVDTYMLLSQNQQLSHIEPLYCQLSHRACLRTQMNYLISSAQEGKTYATIVDEHVGSPNVETSVDENEVFGNNDEGYDAAHDLHDQHADPNESLTTTNRDSQQNPNTETEGQKQPEEHAAQETQYEDLDNHEAHLEKANDEGNAQSNYVDEYDPASAEIVGHLEEEHEALVEDNEEDYQPPESVTADEAGLSKSEPEAHVDANDDEYDPEEYNPELQDEEDLFAGDTEEHAPSNGAELTTDYVDADHPNQTEDNDEFNFDDWDDAEANETEPTTNMPPTTPSKAVNGKRKLVEEDDEFDLDLSTPEPKRTRSS